MKGKQLKLKGKARMLPGIFILLGILLTAMDLLIHVRYGPGPGSMAGILVLLYFIFIFVIFFSLRQVLTTELVAFANAYVDTQKLLLDEMDLPYAILDDEGTVLWGNVAFETETGTKASEHDLIFSILSDLDKKNFPNEPDAQEEVFVNFGDNYYKVILKRLGLEEMLQDNQLFDVTNPNSALIALYMYDETALQLALREVDDQSMTATLVYLDNYDEVMETIEEVKRSMLSALIDRKVNRYVASNDGICRKIEKDKYFVVMTKKSIQSVLDSRFDILEDVKTVSIGNEMNVTLSIGVGSGGLSYAQNYEFARNAIDLALGRGGDQAVVKTPSNISYYGGKSQQVEKNTRVKARVKAHAFGEIVAASDQVIVMGHRMSDVDSFGACIGINRIVTALDRQCHIVMNEMTSSTEPLIELFKHTSAYAEDLIVSNAQAQEIVTEATTLVVVDVNKPSLLECPELLRLCKTIVVFDHHRAGTEVIDNATLSYVEPYASSTCEMISELMQYIDKPMKLTQNEAICMYSGIMIDTDNFVQHTGVRTFEAAAYLRRNGADVTAVHKLFREDVNEYKARADAVSQAEIYKGVFAISVCQGEGIASPTITGAQAANELLNIKGIKASFVCTEYQNQIYVSARSVDDLNVQVIMEKIGGGGHMNAAGVQLSDMIVAEAIALVKKTLDDMIASGELTV